MRQATIDLYKFNELSDEAKQTVIEAYRNEYCDYNSYGWHQENDESLTAFCDLFNINIRSYDIDRGHINFINFTINHDSDILHLEFLRLRTYLLNNYGYILYKPKYLKHIKGKPYYSKCQTESYNCNLTGYCFDDHLLDEIYKFIKNPDNRSFEELISDCLYSWIFAYRNEIEHIHSDEYITEELIAMGYEYYENGTEYIGE